MQWLLRCIPRPDQLHPLRPWYCQQRPGPHLHLPQLPGVRSNTAVLLYACAAYLELGLPHASPCLLGPSLISLPALRCLFRFIHTASIYTAPIPHEVHINILSYVLPAAAPLPMPLARPAALSAPWVPPATMWAVRAPAPPARGKEEGRL